MAKKKKKQNPEKQAKNKVASNPLRQQEEAVCRVYHSYMKDVNKRRAENHRFYGGVDYDTGRVKRRIAGTASTMEEFKSRFHTVCPITPEGFDFETDWTEANATPRLSYDMEEEFKAGLLGAAIWMLDVIRDRGDIQVVAELLPDHADPIDVGMPDVWDPCHSEEMLLGMLSVLQNRNADCVGLKAEKNNGSPKNRYYFDSYTVENLHKQDVPSRTVFEKILSYIPQTEIDRAVGLYMKKYWDVVDRYYKSRMVYAQEEADIRAGIERFNAFWQAADIEIDGDEALQQGLRFNLFHIMQAAGRDGKTGMGAKGLSGEGYEGHYFWDTEMYVLPVFIWTNPELAKQLLLYRYNTLPQARERAMVLGHPIGALYPWRTINGEEASTYFPLGTAQYHINGDIAYAVWQYYEATGDYAFLRDYGAEMLVETARVFADVGGFAECRGGKYCICAVTGPDEYNAIVDNNLYTNLLAQENLYAALRSLEILGDDAKKLSITETEKAFWKKVADNMYLPYDEKLGVYLQDDGFMMRKPYDENSIPEDKRHLLYENYHPLFVYRQRMSKQADAIYGLQLLSDRFTNEELLRNYEFYQTVTLHHSSLSTSIFGMLACRVGKHQDACRYFSESARMDLDDYHENFYAGIHAANMAGTWQSIVFGFAGLRRVKGVPEFSPILPEGWKGYAFSIRCQGSLLKVSVNANGAAFTLENEKPIAFCIRDRMVTLKEKGDTCHEAV